MLAELTDSPRLLIEARLVPIQGSRFQPTGFADLGAATYTLHDGTSMLLVESAQSVANRLEATILGPDNELDGEFEGLSYIRAKLSGDAETSTNSLIEAHRINSPFIISDKDFQRAFAEEADYSRGKPIDWRKVAATMFKYDVNCLLHGAFMANLEDGRVRLQRALTGFIEARDVKEAVSGGVKNNPIDPTGKLQAKDYKKDVYGNVPYQRVEYTAGTIKAYFNLDLGLLRSYELGQSAFELLVALGLLKVRRFLNSGLRLRTACDLVVEGELEVTRPQGYLVPTEGELMSLLKERIADSVELFASPPVTEIGVSVVDTK